VAHHGQANCADTARRFIAGAAGAPVWPCLTVLRLPCPSCPSGSSFWWRPVQHPASQG
jgi:hypothetical protein